APWGNIAGLHFKYANDVGEKLVVVARLNRGAEELYVAAEACKILPQFEVETAGRQFVIVQRIVGGRVTDQRNVHRALRQFFADRQRSLPVRIAVAAIVRWVGCNAALTNGFVSGTYADSAVDKCIGRELTVIVLNRQRNPLLVETVPRLE